jgi:hypothetical protein
VKGGESGGKKLEKETVSAETLEFLKVIIYLHGLPYETNSSLIN